MSNTKTVARKRPSRPAWHQEVAAYARPSQRQALWQLVNTFVPYFSLWALMIYTINSGVTYWVTLALVVIAALLQVRIFIFFHDCGHGSFFPSPRANTILGYITGILTFTPYHLWRHSHAIHHASAGNLDRRGVGDVWTLTVEEYQAAPWTTRIAYRVYRNPFVLLGLGPAMSFVIAQRFWKKGANRRDRVSVIVTNLAILAILIVASLTIGLGTYVLIQLPIILISGTLGIWLFYVQHQYQGVFWARQERWDATRAALEGSSYYKLPRVFRWFTGNIGLHHIHHLRPRIPNYRLQPCYDQVPAMQAVQPLTFRQSLRSLRLNLWDEKRQQLVSFDSL